jgi:hypothetical protein
MASFYSRYHTLFSPSMDAASINQHQIALQQPLTLRMKEVDMQMKVLQKYSQGGKLITSEQNQ